MSNSKETLKKQIQGWFFASPYLLHTLIFFLIPLIWSGLLVFFRWNLISPQRTFVGLKHFVEAFSSRRVWAAFLVTYKFMAIFVPFVMVASIGLAMIVHSIPKFKQVFAVGFFLPYLASGVAVGRVVLGVISYESPLNQLMRNLFGRAPDWLGDPTLAVLVISTMIVWKFSGYYSLIFLSGLQSIPTSLYEAARLDGAGPWLRFWKITLPMLYPSIYTVLILAVGITFGIFTEPFVLTGGGPELATHTWQLEIYYQAFDRFRAGYGASVAVMNAVITFVSILIIRGGIEAWGKSLGFEEEEKEETRV